MGAKHHVAEILRHGRALVSRAFKGQSEAATPSAFDVFLTADAAAINRARQEHLASLQLDLQGKRVLEVGAGIGLHTPFFQARGCQVTVTDGNAENVIEIRRRHPDLQVAQADLDEGTDLSAFGSFDFVYCYGLLYHLAHPEKAIQKMAEVCKGQLLLETCVSLGGHSEVVFMRDFSSNNQATTGIGCRPTRPWVMEKLRQYFGHAYHARTQPDHPDFPVDWACPQTRLLYRAVFVGSKAPLSSAGLLSEPPMQQQRHVLAQPGRA